MQDASDIGLLQSWKAGSSDAGEAFIERNFQLVVGYFRTRLADASTVEDLVQHTFLACMESVDRFRGESSFKTFLLGVARNVLFRFYEQKQRSAKSGDGKLGELVDPGTSPTGAIARREDLAQLARAFQHVSTESRAILQLAFWENLNVVEIADKLEIPLNTAYSRLRRAKLALRSELEGS